MTRRGALLATAAASVVALLLALAAPASAAPDTVITDGPPTRVATPAVSLAFTADQPGATFACSLDFGPPQPCTSPMTWAGLAEGPHTLLVAATDALGAADDTPAERRVVVDRTPPETVVTLAPPARVNAPAATIEFAGSENGPTACTLDGGTPAPCASPLTLTGLAVGRHTLVVTSTDLVGNVDPTPASTSWTVVGLRLLGPSRPRASASGRVTLRLAALAEPARATVAVRRAGAPAAATEQLTAPAGRAVTVRVRLRSATRRSLERRRRLTVRVVVTLNSGASLARDVTVLAPRRR